MADRGATYTELYTTKIVNGNKYHAIVVSGVASNIRYRAMRLRPISSPVIYLREAAEEDVRLAFDVIAALLEHKREYPYIRVEEVAVTTIEGEKTIIEIKAKSKRIVEHESIGSAKVQVAVRGVLGPHGGEAVAAAYVSLPRFASLSFAALHGVLSQGGIRDEKGHYVVRRRYRLSGVENIYYVALDTAVVAVVEEVIRQELWRLYSEAKKRHPDNLLVRLLDAISTSPSPDEAITQGLSIMGHVESEDIDVYRTLHHYWRAFISAMYVLGYISLETANKLAIPWLFLYSRRGDLSIHSDGTVWLGKHRIGNVSNRLVYKWLAWIKALERLRTLDAEGFIDKLRRHLEPAERVGHL